VHESPRSERAQRRTLAGARRRTLTAAVGALCALWFAGVLFITHGHHPVSPDSLHSAIVARNLARGDGFTIGIVPFHVGRMPRWST